jgi:hypothetical protein
MAPPAVGRSRRSLTWLSLARIVYNLVNDLAGEEAAWMTAEQQWAKLALIVETAQEVWGSW